MSYKNILVTGGAGFIGSNLCKKLVELNYNVTSLDNYFTGKKENHIYGVTYVKNSTENICNILFPEFDLIFHLGEYSRVEQSFDDFELIWKFNKLGTHEVLNFAKLCNAKLIYAGSSTKFTIEHETYVKSPYTWSKESNTEYVKEFCKWNDLDYAITYFYNAYGPNEQEDGKYATLIAKYKALYKNKQPLPIVDPGSQIRNFTHISDIIDALILIAEKGHGDEYGIGHHDSYSIYEVAHLFDTDIEWLPARKGNRMAAKVVSEKTLNLGWKPKISLRDHIEEWMCENKV